VYLTTEKSSSTRRAGISVPEESTYAPSIRKMISPPREFTAKAQKSETTRTDQAKSEKAKSKSKHEASQQSKRVKERTMQVENETKQAKGQAKSKTSEVQRQRIPNKASGNKETYRTGSPKIYRATTAVNNGSESMSSAEQRTSKRGYDRVENASYRQVHKPTGMKSTQTRTEKSTKKSTKVLLKPPMENVSMKSTRWSPKRTSKDDYRVPMTTGCKRYSTKHARKHCTELRQR